MCAHIFPTSTTGTMGMGGMYAVVDPVHGLLDGGNGEGCLPKENKGEPKSKQNHRKTKIEKNKCTTEKPTQPQLQHAMRKQDR